MICPACQSRYSRRPRFCSNCGAALGTVPAAAAPQSERRQLTVLFCDMIGSTEIADRIDAEDFRDLLMSYRALCGEIVEQHHGKIERFVGDGILAHFGYPEAREDDAALAVRAALEITARMPVVSREFEARHGFEVRVRVGVNTGPVVIDAAVAAAGESGGLVGGPIYVASRLQQHAPPNGVVMGIGTFNLVRGQVLVEPLEPRMLKVVSEPVELFRVIGRSAARNLFEARAASGLSPLI
ncbi:MAG: adenylate/guanylate cyclase domain-containing protein, partial [Janthinobacterium lividum]